MTRSSEKPRAARWRTFFSNVLAIAYKEARVVGHDKAMLSMVALQPFMMLFIMCYVISNKPANVPWAVLDESRTALSRRLVEEIKSSGYFVEPELVDSYDEGRRLLGEGRSSAFLVIPSSLRRDLERGSPRVQVLLDGSEPLTAARVGGTIAQIAAAMPLERDPGPAAHHPDRPVVSEGPLDMRGRFRFNPTLEDRRFYVGVLGGMLLTNFCLSIAALGLVAERESGTYEHMLSLPTRPIEIVLGKLVPYVALGYVLLAFALIAPGLLLGVWPNGTVLAAGIATLPFILASLAIGVLVSVLARTTVQGVFLSMFFILPSFVLSGALMPYEFMPHGIRELGGLAPLRWYQIASRSILIRGAGLVDVWLPMLALFGIFGLLLLLIRWRMKPRLA